jgi:hypothetical protein
MGLSSAATGGSRTFWRPPMVEEGRPADSRRGYGQQKRSQELLEVGEAQTNGEDR